jgi:hypothetical protein
MNWRIANILYLILLGIMLGSFVWPFFYLLLFLFFVFWILYLGVSRETLFWGLLMALVVELLLNLDLGTVMLAFLVMAGVRNLLGKLVQIGTMARKNKAIPDVVGYLFLAAILYMVMFFAFIAVEKFFYAPTLMWMDALLKDLKFWTHIVLASLGIIGIVEFFTRTKKDF